MQYKLLVDTEEIKGFAYKMLEDRLIEIPSAERPQGEWKHLKGDEWLCSNCGYVIWTDEELERIIHDAKEKARKEIARTKGVTDGNK